MDTQLCMNCGENPAEPGKGTVALCTACKALAKGKERGVKMTPKTDKPKQKSATR